MLKKRKDLVGALKRLTTGIYVLAARDEEGAHGMIASWVTQVSGEPPLVAAALKSTRATLEMVLGAGAFALTVLGREDLDVDEYFCSPEGRVRGNLAFHGHFAGSTGSPILRRGTAYIDCTVEAAYRPGDHVIVVGRVEEAGLLSGGTPLTSHDLPHVYLGLPKKVL